MRVEMCLLPKNGDFEKSEILLDSLEGIVFRLSG
jgi:hypothetical protein